MASWLWSVKPAHLAAFVRTGTFAVRRQGRKAVQQIRPGDRIYAYLSGSRVLAGAFEATSGAFEDATALVAGGHYPHRIRVRPVAVLSEEAYVPYEAFYDKLAALDDYGEKATPDLRFRALVQRVVHRLPTIDGAMLDFLVRTRAETDPERLIEAAEQYQSIRTHAETTGQVADAPVSYTPEAFGRADALEQLIAYIEARGFVYEPWEIAAYVTALRTKPFVLLAGITGVGKSKLPALVAEGTGSSATLLPVRPDWTDPAETLGYVDLSGRFRPGAVLRAARNAQEEPEAYHILVLEEMNLGRPEHYMAEILSLMEARAPGSRQGGVSPPLLTQPLEGDDASWNEVHLPANLSLVGTVNVDESTYPFSRKVLDRAFTLELSATSLEHWDAQMQTRRKPEATRWPVAAWQPRALRLSTAEALSHTERKRVQEAVSTVSEANRLMTPFGIGYRSRDEIALFVLHAAEATDAFRTRSGGAIDPLDLALVMKLLPRLDGSRAATHSALFKLLGWAYDGSPRYDEAAATGIVEAWRSEHDEAFEDARYPRVAARLARMADRLIVSGYTSFWSG